MKTIRAITIAVVVCILLIATTYSESNTLPPMPTSESLTMEVRIPVPVGEIHCNEKTIKVTVWPNPEELEQRDFTIQSLSFGEGYFGDNFTMWFLYKPGAEGAFLVAYLDYNSDGEADRKYLSREAIEAELPHPCDILKRLGVDM
jgi:hypothetical protein